jgi:hypothetical protein
VNEPSKDEKIKQLRAFLAPYARRPTGYDRGLTVKEVINRAAALRFGTLRIAVFTRTNRQHGHDFFKNNERAAGKQFVIAWRGVPVEYFATLSQVAAAISALEELHVTGISH